jgi:hypothetical protein
VTDARQVAFAHNSERQFALLLDFYGVRWEYEPTSFAIGWNKAGEPSQFFTPDFHLPDDDLFIEITTMNQKLVTKKNAKVRRLREIYPGLNCKVLYQRDYLHLVVKYGLEHPENLTDDAHPTRMPGPPNIIRLGDRGITIHEA